MAVRIKSQAYTVIFSIILLVFDDWISIATAAAQQHQQTKVTDQNFYFPTPQRFPQPFPASRNGFFPSNFQQNLPRSQLGAAIQQQPQSPRHQHDESAFFDTIPTKNDGSSSDYFQYSTFPQQQQSPRQQDFFQISPRPFAIQPNGQHGVQFVRPPIVPPPQQPFTADVNFPFPQPRPQLLHANADPSILQQKIVYDTTKFAKQAQAARLHNESAAVAANRNTNYNSIRNNIKKSNESETSQENSSIENNRFPNTRNRFHPLSTTKLPVSSISGIASNYHNNRATSPALLRYTTPEPLPSISTPIVPVVSSAINSPSPIPLDQRKNRIPISTRFGTSREQNTSVRINKFLRQPSREANQQQTIKRINITHNGSADNNHDAVSTSVSVSQEVLNRTHELQLLQQARQKIRVSSDETAKTPFDQGTVAAEPTPQKQTIAENQPSVEVADDDDEEGNGAVDDELIYEDEEIDDENPSQVEVITTNKPKEENKPVILTSNFFLPGKPIPNQPHNNDFDNQEPNDLSSDIAELNDQNKDNADDVIDSEQPDEQTEEGVIEQTTKKLLTEPSPTKITSTETAAAAAAVASTSKVKDGPDDSSVEYEYEYVDYDETTTEPKPAIVAEPEHEQTTLNSIIEQDARVPTEKMSEVSIETLSDNKTVKSNISTSTSMSTSSSTHTSMSSSIEQIEANIEKAETTPVSTTKTAENNVNPTEGYMVVASVQTSRSISGARYLTIPSFPTKEEEERRQLLGDSNNEKSTAKGKDEDYSGERHHIDEDTHKDEDLLKSREFESQSTEKSDESTESSDENVPQSTVHPEISKASETPKLSTISEKLAHLHESNEHKPDITTTNVPIVIRKFSPQTTKAPTRKAATTTSEKPSTDMDEDDELASLLPPGFEYRANSIKETTITTSSTTPKTPTGGKIVKDAAIEIGGKIIQFKEISIDALLPKDYKPTAVNNTTKTSTANGKTKTAANLIKMTDESTDEFLDDDSTETLQSETTKAPFRLSTVTEDISEFLLESSTTKRPTLKTTMDDVSKFLPPGFKLPSKSTTTEMPATKPENANANIEQSVLNKLSFNVDISSLLPPGYKSNVTQQGSSASGKQIDALEKSTPINTTSNSNFKLVFPKSIGKRPGVRSTTARPTHAGGPAPPEILIRKGMPTRATTEFTGWPTVSTTPLSIEKLLQQQGVESIDISEILGKTSSSTSTTIVSTTTTTTTTTVRPTQPGLCQAQCDLAGTIKIVDGVKWKPELLDHNTVEWKNLAKEVETQLNDVYSKADRLKKWFKKIRIDSFSQGSVLVDYFVELADVSRDINTQEIKQMFHSALTEVPMTVVPLKNNASTASNVEQFITEFTDNVKPSRSNYLMGDFILDPLATDFIVIPKQRLLPTKQNEIEQDSIIPQWALAVIVIGAGSLLFVVIFGAAVLLNRQKRSKKKGPVTLTADMLNELNKNHMGGFDNYGNEELYIEDTWDDVKPDFKPKRFANSSSDRDDRFDSWRTEQKYQANADYYYDQKLSKPHYSQKSYAYPPPQNDPYLDNIHPSHYHHPSYSKHQHTHQNAMGMYTYNNRRYNRDYDPDF